MPTILRKISVLVYQKNQTICKLKSNHLSFYSWAYLPNNTKIQDSEVPWYSILKGPQSDFIRTLIYKE